ncbi:MAG: DUF4160 domain-containing protein [Actinomycetota bacterium]|nr:DUF4160 domain-containing protein [Actinomycetota bacterium]
MPRISRFYGIVIAMYFTDHQPPHFHASYGEYSASIDIETGNARTGFLPPRQMRLVKRWATLHRDDLRANWNRARNGKQLAPVAPLP